MDPTGIFFLYVIASPQAECQARVNVNATHGTKTRVADVTLHLTLPSRSIYPAGITIGIFIPCSIVLHFGVGARPFRDMPLYSKGRSTSVAARGRLA